MNYLKQPTIALLIAASSMALLSCTHPSQELNPPLANNPEQLSMTNIDAVSLDWLIDQSQDQVEILVGQTIWINPMAQTEKWRVSLSRHDFAKADIDIDPQKIQRKMSFNTSGQFHLTARSVMTSSLKTGAAPNVMQHQLTVTVKDQ